MDAARFAALSAINVETIFPWLIVVAMPLIITVGLLNLRLAPALRRVRDRYCKSTEPYGLNWVITTDVRISGSDGSRSRTDKLRLAYSPNGLHLRVQRALSGLAEMSDVCVPWQYVTCESSRHFGFFEATFVIRGFDDNFAVSIYLRSASDKAGHFLEQSVTAATAAKSESRVAQDLDPGGTQRLEG